MTYSPDEQTFLVQKHLLHVLLFKAALDLLLHYCATLSTSKIIVPIEINLF